MSGGCVNPIGIAPDLSSLLYIFKSSFSMLFALGSYSYIVPNWNLAGDDPRRGREVILRDFVTLSPRRVLCHRTKL